jgi:hypothetical protein
MLFCARAGASTRAPVLLHLLTVERGALRFKGAKQPGRPVSPCRRQYFDSGHTWVMQDAVDLRRAKHQFVNLSDRMAGDVGLLLSSGHRSGYGQLADIPL